MSCRNEIRQSDIGTIFRATIYDDCEVEPKDVADVSGATTQELIFKKPSGTIINRATTFTTDGTDGQIEYTTAAAHLDETGRWEVQGHVITPAGNWHTTIVSFMVHANLS